MNERWKCRRGMWRSILLLGSLALLCSCGTEPPTVGDRDGALLTLQGGLSGTTSPAPLPQLLHRRALDA